MGEIMGGVRSMMTYIGATQLKEVSKRTTFVHGDGADERRVREGVKQRL